jgi:hypothetical protein
MRIDVRSWEQTRLMGSWLVSAVLRDTVECEELWILESPCLPRWMKEEEEDRRLLHHCLRFCPCRTLFFVFWLFSILLPFCFLSFLRPSFTSFFVREFVVFPFRSFSRSHRTNFTCWSQVVTAFLSFSSCLFPAPFTIFFWFPCLVGSASQFSLLLFAFQPSIWSLLGGFRYRCATWHMQTIFDRYPQGSKTEREERAPSNIYRRAFFSLKLHTQKGFWYVLYHSRVLIVHMFYTVIASISFSIILMARIWKGNVRKDVTFAVIDLTMYTPVFSLIFSHTLLTTPAPSAPPPTQETTSQQPNPPPL